MGNPYPPKGRFNLPAACVLGGLIAFWVALIWLVIETFAGR